MKAVFPSRLKIVRSIDGYDENGLRNLFDWGCHDGWLIEEMEHGEDNASLLKLAAVLGTVSLNGTEFDGKELEAGGVYTVTCSGDGLYDDGLLIYSTTNLMFDCHTDDSCSEKPSDILLLHCEEEAAHGGETLLVHVQDVIASCNDRQLAILRQPIFPFQFGVAPVLTGDKSAPQIRYNRLEIDRFSKRLGVMLAPEVTDVLDVLDEILRSRAEQDCFKLHQGACLVVNNVRFLHGRKAFPKNMSRRLKRLRLHRH